MISEETKNAIQTLWNQGMTGTQIGERLGMTRNAILGAIHRMRAKGHDLTERGDGIFRPKKKRKFIFKPKKIVTKIAEANGTPVGILNLTPRSCRYIVQGGNVQTTKYCNADIVGAGPYCRDHHALCYVPIRKDTGHRVPFKFSEFRSSQGDKQRSRT